MRIRYDPAVDALYIRLREGTIEESDEVAAGVIIDYGKEMSVELAVGQAGASREA